VQQFWEAASCGESSAVGDTLAARLNRQSLERYTAEPYIPRFAQFQSGKDLSILEVGVGMGADHLEWAHASPGRLCGVDLSPRAIQFTRDRLGLAGLTSSLHVGSAEALPFRDESFDLVWSWGVIHHTVHPGLAVEEIRRVLKPGGCARAMIYHRNGILFRLLWLRHALLAGRPFRSLDNIIATEVESAGTKAYTPIEAQLLFKRFSEVSCESILTMGDLIEGPIGRRHGGPALRMLKRFWPQRIVRGLGGEYGSDLLITAMK
jgi:SAM-dependent methyltransferase